MKKTTAITTVLAIALLTISAKAYACTNIIVTKGASKDGSCIVSYAMDSHTEYGELYFKPAADWPKGAKRAVYDWETGIYRCDIEQVPHTYKYVGNMNEKQVIIMETTFGGRPGLENEQGVDYGALIYITLERAKSAREAIAIMDNLVQTYGYPSEGETFSIADKDECWIMEMVGKGTEKGAVWVAVRIPDGYVSAHANQSRIHHFPLNDPENCLYAPDVISFARSKGFFEGKDEDFSFCDAYCPADWSGLRACEARAWSALRILGGANFDADRYLDFAMGFNPENKMPLYVKPAAKVGIEDIAYVMRDHFEGTPMDFSEDAGAGAFRLPYRPRPMSFEIDGQAYMFERSIATQQTGMWYVGQARGWMPDEVGGILWYGVDDAATSALTPIYTSITDVPECFREGNGSMMEYSPTSAFWLFNRVAHFAYLMYDRVAPEVRSAAEKYESENLALVESLDKKALRMVKGGNAAQAGAMLTEFCKSRSQHLFDKWTELSNWLLVKFVDFNVKPQNEDGSFIDDGAGVGIPVQPEHPQLRERWLRAVVKDQGEVMRIAR